MLQKKYRLKNSKAFIATYNNHHILSDDLVCVYFGKEKKDSSLCTRFGFVVSKKIHKRAVVRNRIKRLMRETIRLSIINNQNTDLNKYMSIIFMAKTGSISASFSQIQNSIYNLLNRAK